MATSLPLRSYFLFLALFLVISLVQALEDIVRPPNTPVIGGPAGMTDSQVLSSIARSKMPSIWLGTPPSTGLVMLLTTK